MIAGTSYVAKGTVGLKIACVHKITFGTSCLAKGNEDYTFL